MTWTEILAHVKNTEQCDETEARRQIGAAIEDNALFVRWADERKTPIGWSPMQPPRDEPPRSAAYWQKCKTRGNLVLEPPPYDRGSVGKRTAARLDKKRRFRKPLFQRFQANELWPLATSKVPNDKSQNECARKECS